MAMRSYWRKERGEMSLVVSNDNQCVAGIGGVLMSLRSLSKYEGKWCFLDGFVDSYWCKERKVELASCPWWCLIATGVRLASGGC